MACHLKYISILVNETFAQIILDDFKYNEVFFFFFRCHAIQNAGDHGFPQLPVLKQRLSLHHPSLYTLCHLLSQTRNVDYRLFTSASPSFNI